MDKNTTLVILVIAFLAIGAYLLVNFNGLGTGGNLVSASGTSEIKTNPELVSVYISVETLKDSAQDAKDANTEISNNVINGLVSFGLERKEIQTENFNIYEDYSWENNRQKSNGWKAVNTIVVKTENFDKAGTIVDVAVDNGAIIQGINFEITQETENKLKAQALEQAAGDAKTKAEALAKGSGGKLGSLVSVTSQEFDYRPWPIYSYAESGTSSDAKAAATNIQPKEMTITANVQASYKIR